MFVTQLFVMTVVAVLLGRTQPIKRFANDFPKTIVDEIGNDYLCTIQETNLSSQANPVEPVDLVEPVNPVDAQLLSKCYVALLYDVVYKLPGTNIFDMRDIRSLKTVKLRRFVPENFNKK